VATCFAARQASTTPTNGEIEPRFRQLLDRRKQEPDGQCTNDEHKAKLLRLEVPANWNQQLEDVRGRLNGRPEWTRTIDLFRVKEAL
jgi:hypothetical protein